MSNHVFHDFSAESPYILNMYCNCCGAFRLSDEGRGTCKVAPFSGHSTSASAGPNSMAGGYAGYTAMGIPIIDNIFKHAIAGDPGPPPTPRTTKPEKVGCDHKWKKYVGFMDSFDFCEICDEKRRE